MSDTLRLAVWSGPRNISTAMMRSFGNRADTHVCDEPLYAHYLAVTGLDHPGAEEIIAHHEADWRAVAEELSAPGPYGPKADRLVYYQKHMAHHLLPMIGREWLERLTHVFLIRDPREMLLSLDKVTPNPTPSDTGLPQQVELFEELCAKGDAPPVLDARDVLTNPSALLGALCERVGLEFNSAMLEWPAGRRETDGIWAPHWYASVEASTGFQEWSPREGQLPEHLADVHATCEKAYRLLHANRLTA